MRGGRFVLAALAACAPLAAAAGAVDSFLAFTASTRTATARFEQQVLDRSGKLVDRSSGSFAFSRPGRFRWSYDKPVRSLIVADGTRLWIHDEDLNQVTVRPMDRALSATPAALLAGQGDVTAVFTLREAGHAEGLDWLEAVPKEPDTGFERVRIGMKGAVPAMMELHDSLGGRTVLRFPEFRPGARVDAEAFRFTPPKGADVLDEMPASRPAQPGGATPRKP
ncbi:MAG: outer membrane lipoprotein chaperone LolA [Betaproteobacteria bacterium]|nr:outer membrane lipoprotein chaperone LolA [Betaproteobacteria bacterium]